MCVDRLSAVCGNFGLNISRSSAGKPYQKPNVTVKGTVLNDVEQPMCHFCWTLPRQTNIDAETSFRIAKASSAIWATPSQSLGTKRRQPKHKRLKVYKAVVITTPLYNRNHGLIYSRHARRLNQFDKAPLRRVTHEN